MYATPLYDAKARTEAGIPIINIKPMYAKMLGTCALTVTAAATPKVTRNPRVMKVADFARPVDGKPSLNRPDARKIMPMNIVRRETACIPSMNVLAIPDRDMPTPTIPIEVRPMPGVRRSQSLIS
jgi:hypothetical protein